MKIEINIEKKYVFTILGLIAFLGFVMAQTPNPGHLSDNIWVPASVSGTAQGLNSFLSWVNNKVNEHESEINGLLTSSSVATSPIQYTISPSSVTITANSAYTTLNLPYVIPNGMDRILFRLIQSYSSIGCGGPNGCDIVCDVNHFMSGGSWICSAGTSGQNNCGLSQSCSQTGSGGCTGTDWITFKVDPFSGDSVNGGGISNIEVQLCETQGGGRQTTFSVHAVPYFPRVNGVRFAPRTL